ncbi:MAG: caspase family protein, partial [Planctomycetes bacterium]|nr:caspase family protein [Planctomycetota bacterium]
WSARDWSLLKEVQDHQAEQIAVSPDGKSFCSSNGMQIWSFAGERLHSLGGGAMNQVSFSPDGDRVAGVNFQRMVVKKVTGETVFETPDQESTLYSCAFNPNGKQILSGSQKAVVKIWNTEGELLRTVKPETFSIWDVAVSPDRQHFAVCPCNYFDDNMDPTVKIWNLDGRLEKVLGPFSSDIRGVVYNRDGSRLYAAGGNGLFMWDMQTGKTLLQLKDPAANSIAVSDDEERIVLGRKLLNKNGEFIKQLEDKFEVEWPCFSPDGRRLAIDSAYRVKFFDTEGNPLHTTEALARTVTDLCFSPDSRYVAAVGGNLVLFDRDGSLIRQLDEEKFFASPRCAAFSPDSLRLAVGYNHGIIKIMDLQGKVSHTFEKHDGNVYSVAFTRDGGKVISVSEDGTAKIWSLAGGRHVTLASAGEEWVMYTADGLFDSSRDGGRLVAMTKGRKAYGIDQFALRNNRPDLILKGMGLGSQDLIDHYFSRYRKRLQRAGLDERKLSASLHVPEAHITRTRIDGSRIAVDFELSDAKNELGRYNLFVNDVPLYGSYGKTVSGNKASLSETIDLTAGTNKIEVTCVNDAGAEAFRAITYADCSEADRGDLYFIGFGVSRYRNPELNLKYADKDVMDLAGIFKNLSPSYKEVHIQTFTNEQVTRDSIKQAKENLMRARPHDTLVLFIAGHGVHDTDREATYYYLTHEADLEDLPGTAAEFTLIEDVLQGIPMRNKLFLMDTCESGEIENDTQERFLAAAGSRGLTARTTRGVSGVRRKKEGQAPAKKRTYLQDSDRYIYNDLIRRSGAIVFSSCRGGEFSYENDDLQNGLFTEEIMNALNAGRADFNHDGRVSVDE